MQGHTKNVERYCNRHMQLTHLPTVYANVKRKRNCQPETQTSTGNVKRKCQTHLHLCQMQLQLCQLQVLNASTSVNCKCQLQLQTSSATVNCNCKHIMQPSTATANLQCNRQLQLSNANIKCKCFGRHGTP